MCAGSAKCSWPLAPCHPVFPLSHAYRACVCFDQVAKIVKRFTGIFWQDREATIKRPIESIDERSMAYGSTPFQSWHEIVMHPTLQAALLQAANAPVPPPPPAGVSLEATEAPRGFLVLGSSIGWFPMLAYLQFVSIRMRSTGLLCGVVHLTSANCDRAHLRSATSCYCLTWKRLSGFRGSEKSRTNISLPSNRYEVIMFAHTCTALCVCLCT